MTVSSQFPRAGKGFTLIEIIAGIVVMAVAMIAMTTLILPMAQSSVDPIHEVRAAELGQSLLNEIMGKRFDEQPGLSGGKDRCDEDGVPACTAAVNFGTDGAEVPTDADGFDDVDDYDTYSEIEDQLDSSSSYANLYKNFTFVVSVFYDGDYNGVADNDHRAKRIEIVITTPGDQVFKFAVYKGNY